MKRGYGYGEASGCGWETKVGRSSIGLGKEWVVFNQWRNWNHGIGTGGADGTGWGHGHGYGNGSGQTFITTIFK